MSKSTLQREPHWLNQQQMAAACGISVTAFTKWGVTPVAKIKREAFYTVRDVLDNRLAHQAAQYNQSSDAPDPESIDYQRLRLTREQADNMALKNEQARARLIPIDLLTAILSRVAGEWAGQADTLVPNIVRKFPGLDSAIVESIKLAVVRMQNTVARLDSVADEAVADHAASIDAD